MFTEENIKMAFQKLCELYDEDEYWMLDDDFFELEGISNCCMMKALEDRMVDAFEYKALSDAEAYLDYRGRYLFDQRAVRILSSGDYAVENHNYEMEYDTELWLLEDMSFAIVYCLRTMVEKQGYLSALTEYRMVSKKIECSDDLFFSIEEVVEELDCICSLAKSYMK